MNFLHGAQKSARAAGPTQGGAGVLNRGQLPYLPLALPLTHRCRRTINRVPKWNTTGCAGVNGILYLC